MKKRALFVGVDEYEDGSIARLEHAVDDAEALAAVFGTLLGFERVERLRNPGGKKDILRKVREVTSGLGAGDLFFFFFAGHGFRVKDNHVLVCAEDEYRYLEDEYDGLPMGLLKDQARGPWNRMLVIDACQNDIRKSRGADEGMPARDLALILGDEEGGVDEGVQVVVTSCAEGQKALEVEELGHGLFTSALLETVTEYVREGRRLEVAGLRDEMGERMGALVRQYCLAGKQNAMFGMPGECRIVLVEGEEPSGVDPVSEQGEVCGTCGEYRPRTEMFQCRRCRKWYCRDKDHRDEKTWLCVTCAAEQAEEESAHRRSEESNGNAAIQTKEDAVHRRAETATNTKPKPDGRYCENVDGVIFRYEVKGDETILGTADGEPALASETERTLVIPSSLGGHPVTSIGNHAFEPRSSGSLNEANWTGKLKSVIIPDSVKRIGQGAFSRCEGLLNVTIGNGVTSIGHYAFSGCSSLTSVAIPDSVNEIGYGAFRWCRILSSVTIPDSVTTIGADAFEGCDSSLFDTKTIAGVRLVDGWVVGCVNTADNELILTNIRGLASGAFGKSGFEHVTIGPDVTNIDLRSTFYWCAKLASIAVDPANTAYQSDGGVLFDKGKTTLLLFPKGKCGEYTIPDGVTNIGDWAFEKCAGLTGVSIGNSVVNIGEAAFNSCDHLASVTIGDNVANIGKLAFCGCYALTSVIIPDSVTNIGEAAFQCCLRLTNVTIPDGMEDIESRAFKDCPYLDLVSRKHLASEKRRGGETKTMILPGGAEMEMVWCPPGSYTMGNPDEHWSHHVTVTRGFWMAKYPVTQKQWKSVRGNNPSTFQGDNLPVECVSWNDCRIFCKRAGLRLPTEAQWEYACRAGSTRAFAGTGKMKEMGWCIDNSKVFFTPKMHPVGRKKPNAWGLYDMHGNICEWCLDYYAWPNVPETGFAIDPIEVHETKEARRVVRGGSFVDPAVSCRSDARRAFPPTLRSYTVGFRPCRSSEWQEQERRFEAEIVRVPRKSIATWGLMALLLACILWWSWNSVVGARPERERAVAQKAVQGGVSGEGGPEKKSGLLGTWRSWRERRAAKAALGALGEGTKAGDEKTIPLGEGVEMKMVWCPSGSFWMGSPEWEKGRRKEEKRHHVTLSKGFWLAKHEVTQRQWETVMGSRPKSKHTGGDLPVEGVNWTECQEFCRKLGLALPTEAQWEYACRAGRDGEYGGSGWLWGLGWYKENSQGGPHPVGGKEPNDWGLHDMHGNVREWCADWYGVYPDEPEVTDPQRVRRGWSRVCRGGGWEDEAVGCRSACRNGYPPDNGFRLGFRPAKNLP